MKKSKGNIKELKPLTLEERMNLPLVATFIKPKKKPQNVIIYLLNLSLENWIKFKLI
jgi:hypothetical protein